MTSPSPVTREWPPPGLAFLQGGLRRITMRGWIATSLLVPPVLWLLAGAPGLAPDRTSAALIAGMLLAGLTAFLGGVLATAGMVDGVRRGRRLGYPSRLLIEVLADTRNRTGDAVFGTGPFADVREETRRRVRGLRVQSAALLALAAAAGPVLLAAAALLAFRGAATLGTATAIVLGPPLMLGATAALLEGYAALLVQWDRAGTGWDPGPVTLRDRAGAWMQAVDLPSGSTVPGLRGLLAVAAAGTGGIALFLFVAASVSATAGAGWAARYAGEQMLLASGDFEPYLGYELARPLRLPIDSAIDPLDAGIAIHFALAANRAGSRTGMPPGIRPLPDSFAPFPFGQLPTQRSEDLWILLRRDTAMATRDVLHALAELPAWRHLREIAAAPAADLLGGRWLPGADIGIDALVGPPGPISPMSVARAGLAAAALADRQGRREDAELELRALISIGFLLLDNSRGRSDITSGTVLIATARRILAVYRAEHGDSTLIRMLDAIDEARARGRAGMGVQSRRVRETADGRAAVSLDPNAYPGLRWDAAVHYTIATRCGDLGAIIFGPPPRFLAWRDDIRAALPVYPADSAALALLVGDAPPTVDDWRPDRSVRLRDRALAFIIGRQQLRNACFLLPFRTYPF